MRKRPTIERFLDKIEVCETGCWEWQGSLSTNGYGFIWHGQRNIRAHRFSFEWFNKCSLPKYGSSGLEIDHLCRNHKCVNPDHLELVSHWENIMRGENPELLRQRMLSKTHCPVGHPYNTMNTYRNPNGGRICRTCVYNHNKRYRLVAQSLKGEDK